MKKTGVLFAVVAVGFLAGCLEPRATNPGTAATTLYRHHFAGADQISKRADANRLRETFALPAFTNVRTQAFARLATVPFELWRKHLPAGVTDRAMLVRPLLDDLYTAESLIEVAGPIGRSEIVVAAQLSEARAKLWESNVRQMASAWKLGNPADEGAGWRARNGDIGVQFARGGGWIVVGFGDSKLARTAQRVADLNKNGRPVKALADVLEFEADFPRLAQWFPAFGHYMLPLVRGAVSAKGEALRTEARLVYSEKIPWKFEPWRIPTNMINEPVNSFTVGQGLASFIKDSARFKALGLKNVPNQFVQWGREHQFPHTYIAVPVPDATNALRQLAKTLPDATTNLLGSSVGDWLWASNRSELFWRGLPFISPHIRPVRDGGQEYIFAELLVSAPRTNPAPAELFSQLGHRQNLLYYDWEFTGRRLAQASQLWQLHNVLSRRQNPGTNAPTQQFLTAVAAKLDNTVTEITLAGPSELSFVRRSSLGLTGFEVATLARWIDSPRFPFSFEPPPPLPAPGRNAVPPPRKQ